MKRSSSKLISKAGSVRNINKSGFKFRVQMQIESVDKVMSSSDVVITWERSNKVLASQPAKVDKQTRMAMFNNESLSQEITLFKKKKENSNFEDKVYKLYLRQGSERGKIVGRFDINLAEYVDIPSYSKRIGVSLNSGSRIICRLTSTFIGEAKTKRGSRGSASVGSSTFDLESENGSNDNETAADLDTNMNDLDDLDIGLDDPDSNYTNKSSSTQSNSSQQITRQGSASRQNPTIQQRNPVLRRTPSKTHTNQQAPTPESNPTRNRPIPTPPVRAPSPKHLEPLPSSENTIPPTTTYRKNSKTDTSDMGATNGGAPLRNEFEKLKRENRSLRRKNEDLLGRNQELERRLDSGLMTGGSGDGDESVEQLLDENNALRRDVQELETRLSREPVYADVVRDLRDAKTALALLTLEKDELQQEVWRLRRR